MIEVRDLAFGWGPSLLFRDLSFDVPTGEALAILGPNGAGKTTILRLLAGLLKPRAGEVRLDGRPVTNLAPHQRALRVAYVPQGIDPNLPFTIAETVMMGRYAHLRGRWETEADRVVVRRALATMRLEAVAHRPMAEVSGGERQRALIAAALAQEAPVLLLDEPTTALDIRGRVEAVTLVERLRRDEGRTVVVVTHEIDLAARACSRVLLLGGPEGPVVGATEEVLLPERLEAAFGIPVRSFDLPNGAGRVFVPAFETPTPEERT